VLRHALVGVVDTVNSESPADGVAEDGQPDMDENADSSGE